MTEHHRLPIIELEGLNIDEKETRHDLDKRINKDMDSKNRLTGTKKCKIISE